MSTIADPLSLPHHRLRNRLVLPPLTTNYATTGGAVTDEVVGFWSQRSRHVGLVVVEAAAVRADGRIVPGSLGAWDDGQVAGLSRLAAAVRGQGAVATLQLNHAGARGAPLGGELQGASPSGLRLRKDLAALELDAGQIRRLVQDFASAAGRAVQAGFDGVEIHAAHFYLLSQFLSPFTNRRADRYGGDASGRATFAVEVVRAVRERIGAKALLIARVNGTERSEGAQTTEDAARASADLVRAGVDVVHVSLAARATWRDLDGVRVLDSVSTLAKEDAPGTTLPLAAAVRRAAKVPVIAVGKLAKADTAAALSAGSADLIAIGRQMIADPEAAGKLLAGRGAEIVPCKECTSCLKSMGRGPMICALNATPAGRPTYAEARA